MSIKVPVFEKGETPSRLRARHHVLRRVATQLVQMGKAKWIGGSRHLGIHLFDAHVSKSNLPSTSRLVLTQTRIKKGSGICEVCGFDRFVERAHIIPARFGGPSTPDNLLDLCPNHHTLFDRNALSKDEMAKIASRICGALSEASMHRALETWRDELMGQYRDILKIS